MAIYAFAGEKATRTHENQMLQTFLERLEDRWSTSSDWICVVAFAMWEGTEVDLVCILPSAVLVADFKNYRGGISGTENGPWRADGVVVKGGAKTNPYVQLRDNRFSVINWLNKKNVLTGRNVGHLSACAIFSGPITDQLDISNKSRTWFHVTDFDRCARTLDQLASPELALHDRDFQEIVRLLGVGVHHWTSSRPSVIPLPVPAIETLRPQLTQHQEEAFDAIKSFLRSDGHSSLSVQGMTSTGKSTLMAEAISEVVRQGRQPVALTPNARLAAIAEFQHDVECKSVYQHMYLRDGVKVEGDKSPGDANAEVGGAQGAKLPRKKSADKNVVAIRECLDAEDCVYLIDDAHLLGNSLFQMPDGKRYGSGHLLADLFDFTKIGSNKRHVIFFGDPYQLQRAGPQESVLLGAFQLARDVKHLSIHLDQVVDTTHGQALLGNAREIVQAIRAETFSAVRLSQDESFRIVDRKSAAEELLGHFKGDPLHVWSLADTHAKVSALVQWLRARLHGVVDPDSLEVGDLLEIYVAAQDRDQRSTGAARVQAGQRFLVDEVGDLTQVTQELKGRPQPFNFRIRSWVGLRAPAAVVHGQSMRVADLLEDYLTAEKPELDVDSAIALRAWADRKEKDSKGIREQEATGVNEEDAEESGLPSLTFARYGYASTVHHAQGMTQPLCYVNGEHSAGRHSDAYFRWLYTALTVAERTLVLFNYTPIHPFDSAVWNAAAVQESEDITVGTGWQFDPAAAVPDRDQQRDVPPGLELSKNVPVSAAIWLRIARGAEMVGWRVTKAACHSYQEQYELVGKSGVVQLRVAYNGKNVVTALHFNGAGHWDLACAIAESCLSSNAFTPTAAGVISELKQLLAPKAWRLVSAAETSYRLAVSCVRDVHERISLEINFDKQGLVSSIRPLKCSQAELMDEVRGLFS